MSPTTSVCLATLLRGMFDVHELSPQLAPPSGSVTDVKADFRQRCSARFRHVRALRAGVLGQASAAASAHSPTAVAHVARQ